MTTDQPFVPQTCYMEFPYYPWKETNLPVRPWQVGDFPPYDQNDYWKDKLIDGWIKIKEQAETKPDYTKFFGRLSTTGQFTKQPDGGQKFVLELAGFAKEQVSVEINDDGLPYLSVKAKSAEKSFSETYNIKDAKYLDLEAAKLTMENGLLTIIFPPKKVEKKRQIRLL